MAGGSPEIEQVLALLELAPQRIAALTADVTPAQLRASPAPAEAEWSVNDVLAHLRSCADVWGSCIARLLTEDAPTIRAINPRTWIRQTDYPDLEFRPSLHAFTTQREELLALLRPLSQSDWERTATVTGAGSPLQKTVFSYANRLVIHERPHIKQIARVVDALRQMSNSEDGVRQGSRTIV